MDRDKSALEQRDRALTEAMGECWHEVIANYTAEWCTTCDTEVDSFQDALHQRFQLAHTNPDFSTWEGFGKLWEWAIKQDWWDTFTVELHDGAIGTPYRKQPRVSQIYIHPDHFADAVFEFLKERK